MSNLFQCIDTNIEWIHLQYIIIVHIIHTKSCKLDTTNTKIMVPFLTTATTPKIKFYYSEAAIAEN